MESMLLLIESDTAVSPLTASAVSGDGAMIVSSGINAICNRSTKRSHIFISGGKPRTAGQRNNWKALANMTSNGVNE